MIIKFKSRENPVAEAKRLKKVYGKNIGVRTRVVVSTGEGIDTINNNPDLKFNINITPESNRVLLPADMGAFKGQLAGIIPKINWKNVDLVSVGNEWLIWTTDAQQETIVQTTKTVYDLLTPLGVKVTNSGTPTPLLSAGTYNYYLQAFGQAKADDLLARWKPDVQFNAVFAPRVEKEWNRYIELGMDKLVNTFHFALKNDNIDCVKDIIAYLHYYSKGHEVANNEITVYDSSTALLNRYLTMLKGSGITYAVGYDDNDATDGNMSNPYTIGMEQVLCSFAD